MLNRTDLAVENYEDKGKTKLDGVCITENDGVTVVDVLNKTGAGAIGKPVGRYITFQVSSFANDIDILDDRLQHFSSILKTVLPNDNKSVLVVGIGNKKITADALGPEVAQMVLATRHIVGDLNNEVGLENLFPVSVVSTGVLADTGIETAEIIKGIVNQINPSCVIVVDALAACSKDHLGKTVQISNAGISPGSGVGNHRNEISKATLNVPVVSVGIPTVVSTSLISGDGNDVGFVTPRDIDKIIQQGAKLIAMGINICFQKDLSIKDLFTLVG